MAELSRPSANWVAVDLGGDVERGIASCAGNLVDRLGEAVERYRVHGQSLAWLVLPDADEQCAGVVSEGSKLFREAPSWRVVANLNRAARSSPCRPSPSMVRCGGRGSPPPGCCVVVPGVAADPIPSRPPSSRHRAVWCSVSAVPSNSTALSAFIDVPASPRVRRARLVHVRGVVPALEAAQARPSRFGSTQIIAEPSGPRLRAVGRLPRPPGQHGWLTAIRRFSAEQSGAGRVPGECLTASRGRWRVWSVRGPRGRWGHAVGEGP